MTEKIVIGEHEFICPETARRAVRTVYGGGRHWADITVYGTVEEIKNAFADNVSYYRSWDTESDGGISTMQEDLSAYSVAGDVVDHRDGTITVFMGKPTELELTNAELEEAEAAMREGVNSLE